MRAILLAAVVCSAFPGPIQAQAIEQQWAWCRDDYSERLIRACTAVIRSARQSPENLAKAYFNRGRAWSDKGLTVRAIEDFDQAIKLDPNYAIAIYNRGLASQNLGRADEAAQYFAKAKQAGPRLIPPKE
jgi:tetratricopeptide (TPR) repeat protein